MFERLLVANRGEIARRIMRTCRRLDIETVAVFSDADADAAHVRDADLAVGLGGNTPAESYLRIDALIDAVVRAGATAVHPGYGFLAENADFATAVAAAGAVFVGPTPDAIAAMGSKIEAKRRMAEAGVPVLPSVELETDDEAAVTAAAAELGYPLLVKASAGGGGRGMRIVAGADELLTAVTAAKREAGSAFGDDTVYAERYLSPSRHVEVQIVGDNSGRVIHLGERECSIQRRHQKIIEEAPSPSLADATRVELHAAAVRAGEAIGYRNAGTVEFILGADGEFYFLEVNTRLQVEHPVTEAVLGLDLVEIQLEVASGGILPRQDKIPSPNGHAIEARLYAEDPTRDYLPSTGIVHQFSVPGGVRVDAAFDDAGEVSQYYDSMIAKVVAHGVDRVAAARLLASSLSRAAIDGIRTNRALLVRTLRHPEFVGGQGDSEFLLRNDPAELGRSLVSDADHHRYAAAAALALQASNRAAAELTPGVATGFRNVATQARRVVLARGDTTVDVDYRFARGRLVEVAVDGVALGEPRLWSATPEMVDLSHDGVRHRLDVRRFDDSVVVTGATGCLDFTLVPTFAEPGSADEAGSLVASMPGTVVSVAVAEGDAVEAGDTLVVMEAMKMELAVTAVSGGMVTSVPVAAGDAVSAGQVLVVVDGG